LQLLTVSRHALEVVRGANGGQMRKSLGAIMVAAALSAAACGGKGNAPTAPSGGGAGTPVSPAGPASPAAATIIGSVQNASAGATVGIGGTSMSAALDPAGRFTLANVPAGDVQLQVNSGAAQAAVPIPGVQASQTVEVVVMVSGASASLESEVRHGVGEAELKGVVEALPPTTPALTFKAAGKTVTTNGSTVFVSHGATRTFADLKLKMRVEVKGTLAGDTFTATRVEIEDAAAPAPGPAPAPTPNPPAPAPKPEPGEAELSGTISALSGSASSFQFNIGSRVVKGDGKTSILGSSNAVKAFADLKNGTTVEVKGVQREGFVQASRIKIEGAETEPHDPPGVEAELTGAISALSGTASSFQFNLGSRVVKGDGKTSILGSSNAVKTFADLKNGTTVEVKGVQREGFVQASRIKIEGAENEPHDPLGVEAEVEGMLGAVSGKCPAISSSVSGTPFTASAATEFEGAACEAFKSGDKVQVKGTKKADGSISATRLRRK
jgi:hypothetical protein